jgi:hypothetical protein
MSRRISIWNLATAFMNCMPPLTTFKIQRNFQRVGQLRQLNANPKYLFCGEGQHILAPRMGQKSQSKQKSMSGGDLRAFWFAHWGHFWRTWISESPCYPTKLMFFRKA